LPGWRAWRPGNAGDDASDTAPTGGAVEKLLVAAQLLRVGTRGLFCIFILGEIDHTAQQSAEGGGY